MHIEHHIAKTGWQQKVEDFVDNSIVQHAIVVLIILNAALLGLETSQDVMQAYGSELVLLDHFILGIFILELVLLIIARGTDFFKDPWSVFDFVVIAIALVPATESLSVLRALRVLRLINKVESMRKVVGGLLSCLPSLAHLNKLFDTSRDILISSWKKLPINCVSNKQKLMLLDIKVHSGIRFVKRWC